MRLELATDVLEHMTGEDLCEIDGFAAHAE
jgi:hypothetical protein